MEQASGRGEWRQKCVNGNRGSTPSVASPRPELGGKVERVHGRLLHCPSVLHGPTIREPRADARVGRTDGRTDAADGREGNKLDISAEKKEDPPSPFFLDPLYSFHSVAAAGIHDR